MRGAAARWARIAQEDPNGSAAEHVAKIGPPPPDLVKQQLRKLDRPDKRGTKAESEKVNARAHTKAVRAAESGVEESRYAVPQLVERGRGCPKAASRVRLGLLPSEVFRTGGKRGLDGRFDLREQRELLRRRQGHTIPRRPHTASAATVEESEEEERQGLHEAQRASAVDSSAAYVAGLRPAKAMNADTPAWLVLLSQDVPSGESFWR